MYFNHLRHALAAMLVLASHERVQASDMCEDGKDVSSKVGYRLLDSKINPQPNKKTASLLECTELCAETPGCRSTNYNLLDTDCELNHKMAWEDKKNLVKDKTFVYYSNPRPKKKKELNTKYTTCAKLKEVNSSLPSGYYDLDVNGKTRSVYCDMENFDGGWSLVVSISRSNREHLKRTDNNCLSPTQCVPLATGTLVARKLSDEDIRALAYYEGTFRIDVTSTTRTYYTGFFRLAQGAQLFDSGCVGRGCHRIIASHVYPYSWESNCKGIENGYQIYVSTSCHSVFDTHDNGECGSSFQTTKHTSQRILYGYCTTNGLYNALQGNMYVR